MTQQASSSDPMNTEPSCVSDRRFLSRILVLLALTMLLISAAVFGYGVGTGHWRLPSGATAVLPERVSQLLTRATTNGPPQSPQPAVLNRYRFELERDEFKQGAALLRVRLVDQQSGTLPPDAVIFARRLDMAPEGMPTMTTPLEPTAAPGEFRTDLTMEGLWQLSLAAKVQGETGTVVNKLVFKAVP